MDAFPHTMHTTNTHSDSDSGPYIASGAMDFYTDACVVDSLQLAQSVLFPPPPVACKLGNDLASFIYLATHSW